MAPVDIDECALDIHNCSENANCTNTPGSYYTCMCNSGYIGNGTYCEPCGPNNPLPTGFTGNGTYCEGNIVHTSLQAISLKLV